MQSLFDVAVKYFCVAGCLSFLAFIWTSFSEKVASDAA